MSGGNTSIAAAAALCAAMLLAQATLNAEQAGYGAPIIEKSIRVQDPQPEGGRQKGARFISPKKFGDTVKFYRKLFRGNENIEFKKVATQSGIKAVYVQNKDPKSGWEGMNIYENKGETRIFVLPRLKTPGSD